MLFGDARFSHAGRFPSPREFNNTALLVFGFALATCLTARTAQYGSASDRGRLVNTALQQVADLHALALEDKIPAESITVLARISTTNKGGSYDTCPGRQVTTEEHAFRNDAPVGRGALIFHSRSGGLEIQEVQNSKLKRLSGLRSCGRTSPGSAPGFLELPVSQNQEVAADTRSQYE